MVFFVCVGFLSLAANAAPLDPRFIHAINQVETGGKSGLIWGDYDKHHIPHSLGPLQIRKACLADSGVKGSWTQCTNLDFSIRVMTGYLNRFAVHAVNRNDANYLAGVWNGGPAWYLHPELTKDYRRKVTNILKR